MPWWVTIVILTREIGITLLRLALLRYEVISASLGGKIKTFVQVLAIGLYVLPWPESLEWIRTGLMAAALLLTVGTGVDYVVRAVAIVSRSRREERTNQADRTATDRAPQDLAPKDRTPQVEGDSGATGRG